MGLDGDRFFASLGLWVRHLPDRHVKAENVLAMFDNHSRDDE